jgi:TrmH family RNA methyltransferase
MAEPITSAANPVVRRFRLLSGQSPKHRREQNAFVVEGIQPVWRAVTSGWPIEVLIADADLREDSRAAALLQEQQASGLRVVRLRHDLFLRLVARDGSPGLAAIVAARPAAIGDLTVSGDSVFVALHQIANPGNLGTIIRTVDAAGGAGVILVGDCADPFSPAAVKASMGSLFAVGITRARTAGAFFDWVRSQGVTVLATSGNAGDAHWDVSYQPPLAILFGSEGTGLPGDILARAARCVRIPMTGTAESLNIAAAAAIMLYEIRRHAI